MKSFHLAALTAGTAVVLSLCATASALAQSEQPATKQQQDAPAPDIKTYQKGEREVQEYRVNGNLYAIKVKPAHGPAYYLVDSDGDGNFHRQNDTQRVVVPRWTLGSW